MTNSNGGNGVDRRRLLKGGAATASAAYVAPQIVRTAVAGAQTTTCYMYGVDGNGCSGDPASLDGFDSTIFTQLMAVAPLGTLDRNPCTADPAGLDALSLGGNEVTITVGAGCEIRAVAVADEDGRTLVGTINTTVGGYDTATTGGFIGGITRVDFTNITVSSNLDTIASVAVTVCCTGSPAAP